VELFKKNLNGTVIVEQGKGHLAEVDGVVGLPTAEEELKKMFML